MAEIKTILILFIGALTAHAQLALSVSPVKASGQKAIVPLAMTNNLAGKSESVRLAVSPLHKEPTIIGQPTNMSIGGITNNARPVTVVTNAFYSTLAAIKPSTTTNSNTKAVFNRVAGEAHNLACPGQAAQFQPGKVTAAK